MGHPKVKNTTAFHFEPLFLQDEEMQPLFVGLVKAAFRIQPDSMGPVIPMKEQIAPVLAGEKYGEPEKSSYKYEPECVPFKPNTDTVLIGTARAPTPNMTQFDCGFRVGDCLQLARIFGDRFWHKTKLGMTMSEPEVVTKVPLIYENAFGGVDTSVETKHGHPFEQKNPVGKGYHKNSRNCIENAPLPNIEDPNHLITHYTDCPTPIGFGFTSPNWLPRRLLAGTYDKKWEDHRSPKLALDFNPLFYNASPQKLMAKGYLQGNEPVQVYNASPWPKLKFSLPGINAPSITVTLKNGKQIKLLTVLDTVVVNTDDMLLFLHFRCRHTLTRGAHDISVIAVD
ncbi:DUF2169 domain-containing protein [uncultured Paraglaciecola sp.]|uniref:DUF2169 family type VI secretion system accessory protein n=1 Tax=uncultured Paraglaciecola sp. TaxID=1765024 RepID=UPI0030DC233F|tara:strand:- start:180918 stop:181937 length:1020 start_codon:yes stop_codon:yes gene_type:complete